MFLEFWPQMATDETQMAKFTIYDLRAFNVVCTASRELVIFPSVFHLCLKNQFFVLTFLF